MELPAELHGGLMFVRAATAGGPSGLFLIDTGAAATVLDARLAAQRDIVLGDPVRVHGGDGDLAAQQAENVTLALPGAAPLRIDPLVADLGPVSRGMGLTLDGVIGDDVLRRFVVTLDFRAGRIRLSAPDGAPPPDAVPMRFIATPFIEAEVQDAGRSASAMFQIDTGSNTAVEFWAPFAHVALPQAATTPGAEVGLAGAGAKTARGRIDALIVAGRRIAQASANFADYLRPDDAGAAYGGVIGAPAWSGLALTLDFPERRVWVR
ncbi:MAG: aspartyl protease family protein [Caulobacteraceae bacterium]|nr:aspartyl protease family protein [Caulobacteraceae bacterium]